MNKCISILAIALALTACKHKEETHLPAVDVKPTPIQTPTPNPTPKPLVCSQNPTITCYGFKFQGCDKFSDAGDLVEKAQADQSNACMNLDGVKIYNGDGFGPCMTCGHLK